MSTFALRGLRASALPRSNALSSQWASRSSIRTYVSENSEQIKHEKPRNNRVNPPSSTLPPLLELPQPDPSVSKPKHLIKTGLAYYRFYKTGVKAIWTNLNLTKEPQKLVDLDYKGAVYEAVKDRRFTRADYQVLLRSWHDVKRVPIFGLIFAVCGEFTPFVVVAIPNAVPYTCRIPAQVEGQRKQLEKRRMISFSNLKISFEDGMTVNGLDRAQLLHITWSLGLAGKVWDYIGGTLPGLPTWILRGKVAKRIEYIETDDRLIRRDGGVEDMIAEEVKIACSERGMDVVGKSEEENRMALEAWLKAAKKEGALKMLLTRQDDWPLC